MIQRVGRLFAFTPVQSRVLHSSRVLTNATKPAEISAAKIESSCKEGTVMTGLNIMKGSSDPVAKADSEYPEWLWEMAHEIPMDELPPNKQIARLRREHIKKINTQLRKR